MSSLFVLIFSSLYIFPICKYKYKKGNLNSNQGNGINIFIDVMFTVIYPNAIRYICILTVMWLHFSTAESFYTQSAVAMSLSSLVEFVIIDRLKHWKYH